MIERLHYELDAGHDLRLDVPADVYADAMSTTRLPLVLEQPAATVRAEEASEGTRLTFDRGQLQRVRSEYEDAGEALASHWLYALNAIASHTPDGKLDPRMSVHMSDRPLDDASGQYRRGMRAELATPEDFRLATSVGTRAMRFAALSFGYLDPSIQTAAFALVERRGIEFQALDIGCCCLSTQGEQFLEGEGRALLSGHNLYNRQLSLTCLYGLVAVANASSTGS